MTFWNFQYQLECGFSPFTNKCQIILGFSKNRKLQFTIGDFFLAKAGVYWSSLFPPAKAGGK